MKARLAEFVDYGVAGIVARRVAGYHMGLAGDEVHHPPFAFVSPLTADDNDCWHNFPPEADELTA